MFRCMCCVLLLGCMLFAGCYQAFLGSRTTCLDARGCPEVPLLPKCQQGFEHRTLGEVMGEAADLLGQQVVIASQIHKGPVICTELQCGKRNPCCNRCHASFVLADEVPDDFFAPGFLRIAATGSEQGTLRCEGDDSLVCCPFDGLGGAVVATGTMAWLGESVDGPLYELREVTLCRL